MYSLCNEKAYNGHPFQPFPTTNYPPLHQRHVIVNRVTDYEVCKRASANVVANLFSYFDEIVFSFILWQVQLWTKSNVMKKFNLILMLPVWIEAYISSCRGWLVPYAYGSQSSALHKRATRPHRRRGHTVCPQLTKKVYKCVSLRMLIFLLLPHSWLLQQNFQTNARGAPYRPKNKT